MCHLVGRYIFVSFERDSKSNSVFFKPILSAGMYMPDGIAVDWIGENIYFTESRGNRIDVVNLEGRFRHVLVDNLGSPRGLAVDPSQR